MPHESEFISRRSVNKMLFAGCVTPPLAVAAESVFASPSTGGSAMVQGLATVVYHVSDLEQAKAWYAQAFGKPPYFDEPFYVGFEIGGYELGLLPTEAPFSPGPGGAVAYWRVQQIQPALDHFVASGAELLSPAKDVGGGIQVAAVTDPFGNPIGLIENPHFQLPAE